MSSDMWINLGEDRALKMIEELKAKGLSEDDAFSEVYSKECNLDEVEVLKEERHDLFEEFIELANEKSNYAFKDVMDYDRAYQFLDVPGWGMPDDAKDILVRLKEIKTEIEELVMEAYRR